VPDVDSASGAPPVLASGVLGEQQVQGGQVRHDEILADVGVLRPRWAGRGGGGVAVAAQPAEHVPPLLRAGEITAGRRTAGGADVLGGDEVGFADQRRVDG
jgi:hypothetical protein